MRRLSQNEGGERVIVKKGGMCELGFSIRIGGVGEAAEGENGKSVDICRGWSRMERVQARAFPVAKGD
jgi:hypothetical protein